MTTSAPACADELVQLLSLSHPPVGVTMGGGPPDPDEGATGRLLREPAGCCFWRPAETASLETRPIDHAGCSVGSYTHGMLGLEAVAVAEDTTALLASGWVTRSDLAVAPRLPIRPTAIRYEPLGDAAEPDIVLLRLSPASLTTLFGARPDLVFVGKPQCQIVPLAYSGRVAVSPGCAVSRHRTGLPEGELTCALPTTALPGLLVALRHSTAADRAVAAWTDVHDPAPTGRPSDSALRDRR